MQTATNSIEIDIPPPLSIRNAQAIKRLILEAMSAASQVTLRLPDASSADLSFIQLIEAARAHAARNNINLSLKSPAKAPLLDTLDAVGLDVAAKSFWIPQGDLQ